MVGNNSTLYLYAKLDNFIESLFFTKPGLKIVVLIFITSFFPIWMIYYLSFFYIGDVTDMIMTENNYEKKNQF